MENVVQFPHPVAPVQPIANFIRLGETGHHKLAGLLAVGKFPAKRVVVDASRLQHQRDLVSDLRARSVEIVLDTKSAELSALEKFSGYSRNAPWASIGDGKPLTPAHFDPKSGQDIFGQIARFAIEHKVDVVLAPTHFIGDPNHKNWFEIDCESCLALRRALDREGGHGIAIDYTLIVPHTMLNDSVTRSDFMAGLARLPFDNLWIRASGFGSSVGPLAARRFITSMMGLHNLGRPVVADCLGGIVGHAALAVGGISGLAHGIGERERFDARSWHKPVAPRSSDDKFGRAVRVFISGLDRSTTVPELELMALARGGRKLVACGDRSCCPHGLKDMIADPRQHAAYQNFRIIDELATVPDLNRELFFLNGRMAEVDRHARQVKDLKLSAEEAAARKIDPANLTKRLIAHSKHIEKVRMSLEHLHETRGDAVPRARPVTRQVAGNGQDKADSK
jgi:hypothetical protein